MGETGVAVASSPRAAASSPRAAASSASVASSPRAGGVGGRGGGHHHRRWGAAASISPSYRAVLLALWLVGFALVFLWQSTSVGRARLYTRPPLLPKRAPSAQGMGQWVAAPPVYDLREFGGVGDGRTLNTEAFVAAVASIAERGGGRLVVPAGRWLTAPFNLTSRMTLFLAAGAEILGVQDERYWPLMSPLPSYGYGREHRGPRYGSLIHGQDLKDVTITGQNGTINGQGQSWWSKFRKKVLNHTRGPLVQLMRSSNITISNITLRDSPFWTLHIYDCKDVTISDTTILAPIVGAPNTDGIDPDSCENVVIKNCYISVGDDGIAIKSGWDQYGIAYGRPSTNIIIHNVTIRSMVSAGVSIGSEMSGGVSNVLVENVHIWDSRRGVRIKTAPGRGAYVSNITYRNITLEHIRVGIVIKTDYNEHPDEGFDPKAVPIIENISYSSIHGHGVRVPVRIQGSAEIPVKNVTFHDMSVGLVDRKNHVFQCSFVQGQVVGYVFPVPCKNLDLYNERRELDPNLNDRCWSHLARPHWLPADERHALSLPILNSKQIKCSAVCTFPSFTASLALSLFSSLSSMALPSGSFAACSIQPRVGAALRAPALPSQKAAVARMASHRAGATKGGVSAVCEPLGPDRPLWFPGSSPPPWLDGSLPGDFGFDPLGLGSDPELLRWFAQAELMHSRWAMLAVAGILVPEVLEKWGFMEDYSWIDAGARDYFADPWTLFVSQMALMGWAEGRRWADYLNPGCVAVEPRLPNRKNPVPDVGYPGGLWFDWGNWGRGSPEPVMVLRTKEIKNGRLAMLAFVGFWFQAVYTGEGPIDNLLHHLADPGHCNVFSAFTSH
uniref:Chlorophyll a-b binding protein, chloroplastic n=1 Tax=Oryza meridionalis TaxID=40149 RepID=A0A0E0ESL9_9ORYZ